MTAIIGVLVLTVLFATVAGSMLNYLDTGNPLKILPGGKVRFWCLILGTGIAVGLTTLIVTE